MNHEAFRTYLTRTLPSGLIIEFTEAPAGWPAKNGQPRLKDWRAYHLINGNTRTRVPSVTTLIGEVMPKPGLSRWAEARGIEGACEAHRVGLLPAENPVEVVRNNRLGADRAAADAADRGTDVHSLLERYARTGELPDLSDHPPGQRPYIQGLVRWIRTQDPEPVLVEALVADPDRGYAGRLDLIARIAGRLTVVDLKTNARGQIRESAHLQVRLLREAEARYGEHEATHELVVAVDAAGGFHEMAGVAPDTMGDSSLIFRADAKKVISACVTANRIHGDLVAA
jgi:hypothetical protein